MLYYIQESGENWFRSYLRDRHKFNRSMKRNSNLFLKLGSTWNILNLNSSTVTFQNIYKLLFSKNK